MKRSDAVAKWLEDRRKLNSYTRFEQIVALVLNVLISAVVILFATSLFINIILAVFSPHGIMNCETFRAVFGMILVILIALESNHTIVQILERKESIVQVRIVIIIAILAIVRKYIVVDIEQTTGLTLIALAAIVLALGATYWLVLEADRQRAPGSKGVSNE